MHHGPAHLALSLACCIALCGPGCGGTSEPVDGGGLDAAPVDAGRDAMPGPDAGPGDAGPDDAGPDDAGPDGGGEIDGGETDAGTPDARICATEICNGLDDDCDDTVDESLVPPACSLTDGVCAFAVSECSGALGWACDYGPGHQSTESRCDGFDNDCDGVRDEGCGCPATGPCGQQIESRWDLPGDVQVDPWAIEQLAGGDLVVVGDHGSPRTAWVASARLDGTVVWARTYGGTRPTHLRDVEPLPDGGLAAVGYVENLAPLHDDVLVLRLDATGGVVWARSLDGAANERGAGIELDGDSLVIGGQAGSESLFLELALDGSIRRSQRLDGAPAIERARDVAVGASGPVLYGEVSSSTGMQPFLYEIDARRGVLFATHDIRAHRVRVTADGGFLISGMAFGYSGDTGTGFSAGLTPALARRFWHSINETYSDQYDTVELTSGALVSGGSNAWATIEALSAAGATTSSYVYRPLALSGRNEVRALVPLADGGFAAVAQDGSQRMWIFRGNASGQATSCTRVDGWWTTNNPARDPSAFTAVLRDVALTEGPIALTTTSLAPTATAVCASTPY